MKSRLCKIAATTAATFVASAALAQSGHGHSDRLIVSPTDLASSPTYRPGFDPNATARGGTSPGVQAAADNIIALQCPDGGWNWPYGGCASTFANIDGPIGLGLLRAYELLGDDAILDSALEAGAHNLANVYPIDGETRFSSFQAYFFYRLSVLSGDPSWSSSASTEFFGELDAATYGDPDYDTAGWIGAVEAGRSGSLINLRPWDFHLLPIAADLLGTPAQRDMFRDAVRNGLNTLDESENFNLIGLAGGIRGIALAGESTVAALDVDGGWPELDGLTDLCDLVAELLSHQNADGSWNYDSTLVSPGESDKDMQTTAYAVLALLAAQDVGCGPYDAEINKARAWMDTLQDVDGSFFSYPGGDKNIEVNAEALEAWATGGMRLISTSCEASSTLTVTIDIDDLGTFVVGGQYRLMYDTALLDFVSADAIAPWSLEIFESVDTGVGTIDYAVGVPGGGPGATGPATMVELTFDVLGEDCNAEDLVTWRFNTPPSQLTDIFGTPVLPTLFDLDPVRLDQTPPTVTCPADVMVNSDAGTCTAVVDTCSSITETFDDPVAIAENQAPGVWYEDRYPPFAFEIESFLGDSRLKHSIDASDCQECRPASFNSAFYNTQGRKFDIPGATKMSIDLYVPSAWATTGRRMAGFWATAFDSTASISGFPILEFASDDSNPRFQFFTQAGFVDLGLPTGFVYDEWYALTIEIVGGEFIATVGDITFVDTVTFGSVELGNVILQGYNTTTPGVTYDIYWDNFVHGFGAYADDNCEIATLEFERSDNPALGLDDPFPTGVTMVTYTATDTCGNTDTCVQTITVSGVSETIVDLAYNGPLDDSVETEIDRCIEFVFEGVDGPTTVSQVVSFDSTAAFGEALGVVVEVPCGDYDCLTVRDPLHTLARSVALTIVGTQYTADATGSDAMIAGDLNDDNLIDILDFGIFVGQFGPGSPIDTDCSTAAPHADITGNGVVDGGDFGFISLNFFTFGDSGCAPLYWAGDDVPDSLTIKRTRKYERQRPLERISVIELRRRGLDHLIPGDLNNDKWLDQEDIAAFLSGAAVSIFLRPAGA